MNNSSNTSLAHNGVKEVRAGKGVYILIASGFEEESVAACLSQMRASGVRVRLVGTSAGLISGHRGLTVRPDCSLNQLDQLALELPELILLPGNCPCASELAADPRVHQLIDVTLRQSGYLAATRTAESVLANVIPPLPAPGFMPQGDLDTHEFINQLVNLVSS